MLECRRNRCGLVDSWRVRRADNEADRRGDSTWIASHSTATCRCRCRSWRQKHELARESRMGTASLEGAMADETVRVHAVSGGYLCELQPTGIAGESRRLWRDC